MSQEMDTLLATGGSRELDFAVEELEESIELGAAKEFAVGFGVGFGTVAAGVGIVALT